MNWRDEILKFYRRARRHTRRKGALNYPNALNSVKFQFYKDKITKFFKRI